MNTTRHSQHNSDRKLHNYQNILVQTQYTIYAVNSSIDYNEKNYTYHAEKHLKATGYEQESSAEAIHNGSWDEDGSEVDESEYNSGKQRRVVAEAHRLKEVRSIEGHNVDPRKLLRQRNSERHHQLRPVLFLKDGPNAFLLHGFGNLRQLNELLEFGFHVDSGAPHFAEGMSGFVYVVAFY